VSNSVAGVSKRTLLSVSTALDPRWKDAPAAATIEILEETGAPVPVPPNMIDKVDQLIAGSLPGSPTLPKGTTLAATGARWTPPADDPSAALKFTAKQGQPAIDGCSFDAGNRRPFGFALLAALSLLALLVRRRLT
jgi:hypothetical protein